MSYITKSYVKDQRLILSNKQALPNNASVDSTGILNFGASTAGRLKIVVVAGTNVSIAATHTLTIVAAYGATSAPTDTLFKTLFSRTAPAGGYTYPAGTTICEEIIIDTLPPAYQFCKLIYTTTANESAETVDAFIALV